MTKSLESHTATTVAAALRNHYQRRSDAPSGLFMEEIGAPDGRRRADVIWVPAGISGAIGRGFVGHEIKISRADVAHELEQPDKAESWAKYCTQWWLTLSDARLIAGMQIPDQWGVMAVPKNARHKRFDIIKDAPKLEPVDLTPALARLSTVLAYERMQLQGRVDAAEGQVRRDENRTEEIVEQRLRQIEREKDPFAQLFDSVGHALDQLRTGGKIPDGWTPAYLNQYRPAEIARVLADVATARKWADTLKRAAAQKLQQIESAVEPVIEGIWESGVKGELRKLIDTLDQKEPIT